MFNADDPEPGPASSPSSSPMTSGAAAIARLRLWAEIAHSHRGYWESPNWKSCRKVCMAALARARWRTLIVAITTMR